MAHEDYEDDDYTVDDSYEEVEDSEEKPKEQMVPLSALLAERRKNKKQVKASEEKVETAPLPYVTHDDLNSQFQNLLEQDYINKNPEKIEFIEKHAKKLFKEKPHLKRAVAFAPNRYEETYKLLNDYMGQPKSNEQKIDENMKKPGSPTNVAKEGSMSQAEYIRSIAGTSEFRSFRQKIRSGRG